MAFWTLASANLHSRGVDRAAAEAYRDGRLSEIPPNLLEALEESPFEPDGMQDYIDEVDYR
jgi:hypothetical protein